MSSWWEAFWFFLPAGVANLTPVFVNKIPFLNRWKTPLDFGKFWRGKRIFGTNKTWRGLLFGVIAASLTGIIQYRVIGSNPEPLGFIVVVSAAMGFGALAGDAIKSFFKRRYNVKPGKSWFPFDQSDYIIGGLIFIQPFIRLNFLVASQIFIIYFLLHIITAYFSYRVGLKDTPI